MGLASVAVTPRLNGVLVGTLAPAAGLVHATTGAVVSHPPAAIVTHKAIGTGTFTGPKGADGRPLATSVAPAKDNCAGANATTDWCKARDKYNADRAKYEADMATWTKKKAEIDKQNVEIDKKNADRERKRKEAEAKPKESFAAALARCNAAMQRTGKPELQNPECATNTWAGVHAGASGLGQSCSIARRRRPRRFRLACRRGNQIS